MSDPEIEAWDNGTIEALEDAYTSAGAGPGGSGSSDPSAGIWRAKRQHLAVPMDTDGTWLDVGCANGHLLATLPAWAGECSVRVDAHGLELIESVAELARLLHPELAERIWTGSVMSWQPPMRFRYVTALADAVPPDRLGELVDRLLTGFVEPGGRLIVSSYTERDAAPRDLFGDLAAVGHRPDGRIHIDRPGRHPLLTAWIDST